MEEPIVPYVIPLTATKPKQLTLVPSDPGSRYKTRQLQIQVVGKSKMIRTMFVNVLDVAKDMLVPPSYIVTFLGYSVGAQSKFDPKKPERQQGHVSGDHDVKELSRIMGQFIREVLSCPSCTLPELNIVVSGQQVLGKCRSCGAESPLQITDEKFKRFIINHPPTQGKAFDGNKAGGVKKEKEKEKDKGEKEKEASAQKPKKQATTEIPDDDEVVWYSDTSAEAARKRAEEMLPELAKKKEMGEELKQLLNGNDGKSLTAPRLKELQKKFHATDPEAVEVVFGAVFKPTDQLPGALSGKEHLFAPFCKSSEGQHWLLRQLEHFCGKENAALLDKSPLILKAFYDVDLLEEENILPWYEKTTPSSIPAFREKVQPFITWLKEEEEEDEEEEEEDEE